MRPNILEIYDRLFKEMDFNKVVADYALEVDFPEEKCRIRLLYKVKTDRGEANGVVFLPPTFDSAEGIWRRAKQVKQRLQVLRAMLEKSGAVAGTSSSESLGKP